MNEDLTAIDINLPDGVKVAFDAIIEYFKINHEIPSLVYISNDIEKLYKKYLDEVIKSVEQIEEGAYLNKEQKGLFCLGIIEKNMEIKKY